MHDREPHFFTIPHATELHLPAVYLNLALERTVRVDSTYDTHQGRLSSAVFTADTVNFSPLYPECYVVQRPNTREILGYMQYFQNVFTHNFSRYDTFKIRRYCGEAALCNAALPQYSILKSTLNVGLIPKYIRYQS